MGLDWTGLAERGMDCPLSRKMLATKWEENNMKKGQRGYFGITIIIPTSNDPKNHNKNRIPAKLLVKRVITPEVLCMVGGYFPSHTSSTATIHVPRYPEQVPSTYPRCGTVGHYAVFTALGT